MLSTALLILLLALVFAGVGLLFPPTAYRREPGFETLAAAFWIGWALVLGVLQLWHLFFPVGLPALILWMLAGLAGWGLAWRTVRAGLPGLLHGKRLALTLLGLIPALVIANHVMFVPAHTDHGLYHLQMVKWIENYAIVPGLGNLHHRLAFNNANFLIAALLNAGPLFGRSYYLDNTLLGFVLILQCAAGVYALFQWSSRPDFRRVHSYNLFYALMLVPVIWQISTTHLPGYSPDVPVFALQVVLGGELLRLFELGADRARFQRQALLLVLLAAAGITVKLSFIVFGALILLTTAGLWLARFQPDFRRERPAALRAVLATGLPWLGLGALLVLPWMLRFVLLSGYLFYPSIALPFPVAWRIPLDQAEPVAGVITLWARTASSQIAYTGDWNWFFNWLRFFVYEARMAFFLTLGIAALNVMLYLRLRKCARVNWPALVLSGISLVSLVYWFIMAPDYRFSGATFWILLAATLMLAHTLLTSAGWVPSAHGLGLALVLALALWLSPNLFSKNLSLRLLLNPIPEPQLAAEVYQPSDARTRQTASGLTIYLPPDDNGSCWDLPLPCTQGPDFSQKLRLFDPNNLQKGFYIDLPSAP